jgi:hypothetical protein
VVMWLGESLGLGLVVVVVVVVTNTNKRTAPLIGGVVVLEVSSRQRWSNWSRHGG